MRRSLPSFVLALVCCIGSLASAQAAPSDSFSVHRFTPAPGSENYLGVDGAVTPGHMAITAGLLLDYAHRPLSLYEVEGNPGEYELGEARHIVSMLFTGNLMGSFTISDRIQIGLNLPLIYTSGESWDQPLPSGGRISIPGGSAFALGDPRLSGKVNILGQGADGFNLAASAFVTAPLGQAMAEERFVGDGGVTTGIQIIPEFRQAMFRFAANIGAAYRGNQVLLSTEAGSEMTYGLAGSVAATPLLNVMVEIAGSSRLTKQVDENPMEARIAGQLRQSDLVFTLGAGAGVISGIGVPVFRVLGGASWAPQALDSDRDGVRDTDDQCPTEAEDLDGVQDEDGCPDSDNDGDGVDDSVDRCPSEPEDPDGFEDTDGCPDRDNDRDNIPDGYDSCPNDAEDMDGDRDEDGCPDNDRDRDGVPDETDKCPDQAEDTDGFGDEDGCPEEDFDGDTILDDADQCPDQAEDLDGFEDEDGCPEEGAPTPTVTPRRRTRG